MKSSLKSPFLKNGTQGFSLLEMLVALAVFAILMSFVGQLLSVTENAWRVGVQESNNLTRGRALLDVIALDIKQGVFRNDLPAFPAAVGDNYSFYTQSAGSSDLGTRPVSLVNYLLTVTSSSATLQRQIAPVDWTGGSGENLALGTTNAIPMKVSNADDEGCSGVINFALFFLNADSTGAISYSSTYSNTLTSQTKGIGFTLLVADNATANLLGKQGNLLNLQSNFPVPSDLTGGIKSSWDKVLNGTSGSLYAGGSTRYPAQMKTGLQIFEKVVYLTTAAH
jgi:prepilin-type N-terminal cleavage/methylation domain-containing protein